ncbi:MAG: SPFH/Band 7/PHB domain protein [Fusobacterium sp.]|nr:SPFH/Band 7/PHB domain protein [Fusobacterium sp.]
MFFLLTLLIAAAVVFVVKGVFIVEQQEVVIIQRLGKYLRTLSAGFNLIIPFLDAPRPIAKKVTKKTYDGNTYSYTVMSDRIDMRESVYDFPRQNVITKDNVSITINALLYFQIVDAHKAVYGIDNLPEAIEKLTQTNLRNLVGQMELQDTLTSREKINGELRTILDDATNKWGVKVNRVELQDIIPPADIQAAMDKQMKAEREKRAMIYEAEGQKEAAIRIAEGQREAAIKKAEGEKQAAILTAEGVAQARVVEAEAEKTAIRQIIEALEDKGQPDKYLIAMKYLETLTSMTDGKDNKVIYMPYEATGILSSVDGIKEMFKGTK